jgi:hypothetical protein
MVPKVLLLISSILAMLMLANAKPEYRYAYSPVEEWSTMGLESGSEYSSFPSSSKYASAPVYTKSQPTLVSSKAQYTAPQYATVNIPETHYETVYQTVPQTTYRG